MFVSDGLSRSWEIAEPFFRETSNRIWGRDFLTWILLTTDDPHLYGLFQESTPGIDELRDERYAFVATDRSHLPEESWMRWWRAAGVPLPQERVERKEAPFANDFELYRKWAYDVGRFSFRWHLRSRD